MMIKVLRHNLEESTITVMFYDGKPDDDENPYRLVEDVPVMDVREVYEQRTSDEGEVSVERMDDLIVPFQQGIKERVERTATAWAERDKRLAALADTFKGAPAEGEIIKV